MTKKNLKRASSDVGFMMTAYNLRRIMNILGIKRLGEYLESSIDLILSKIAIFERVLAHMLAYLGETQYQHLRLILPVKRLSLIQISEPIGGY